jgi:hypothetical protein
MVLRTPVEGEPVGELIEKTKTTNVTAEHACCNAARVLRAGEADT